MWSQIKYQQFVHDLQHNTPTRVASWLNAMLQQPCGRPDVLLQLDDLLNDRRIATLALPGLYGEVRWLVAQALVNERYQQQGTQMPILLSGAFAPMTAQAILTRMLHTNLTMPHDTNWAVRLNTLRDTGRLDPGTWEFRHDAAPHQLAEANSG